ncbi:unnamed protein product, partial [marine sediment metagenome]
MPKVNKKTVHRTPVRRMSLEKQFASSELWDVSRTDVDKAYFQSVLTFDNIKEIEYRQDKRIKTSKVKFAGSSLI